MMKTNSLDVAMPQWQLEVTSGLHSGAILPIQEGELLVIGNSDECDIILHDDGVSERHIALTLKHKSLIIKILEGSIQMDEQVIDQGQLNLEDASTFTLLNTSVILKVGPNDKKELDIAATVLAQQAVELSSNPTKWRGVLNISLPLLLLIAVFLNVYFSTDVSEGDRSQKTNLLKQQQNIESTLAALKINTDVKLSTLGSELYLTGVLPKTQLDKLKTDLRQQQIVAIINIISPEQLLEQVSDVFRINGYNAKLNYLSAGKVQVLNLDGTHPKVSAVLQHVKRDVPNLAELEFKSTQNTVNTQSKASYFIDSAKTLMAIVDDGTAYVSAQTGARYFIGSMLPNGYSIKQITTDGVQADKNGEMLWLYF